MKVDRISILMVRARVTDADGSRATPGLLSQRARTLRQNFGEGRPSGNLKKSPPVPLAQVPGRLIAVSTRVLSDVPGVAVFYHNTVGIFCRRYILQV